MLASASCTFLKIFVSTAMRGVVEDTLGAAQAGLASELNGHAAGTLGQGLLRLGRHDGAARRLELSERYEG
jgi:hypothetical protein